MIYQYSNVIVMWKLICFFVRKHTKKRVSVILFCTITEAYLKLQLLSLCTSIFISCHRFSISLRSDFLGVTFLHIFSLCFDLNRLPWLDILKPFACLLPVGIAIHLPPSSSSYQLLPPSTCLEKHPCSMMLPMPYFKWCVLGFHTTCQFACKSERLVLVSSNWNTLANVCSVPYIHDLWQKGKWNVSGENYLYSPRSAHKQGSLLCFCFALNKDKKIYVYKI